MPDRQPGFIQRTALTVERGAVAGLPDHLEQLGVRRPVVLIDANLDGSPVDERVARSLHFEALKVVAPAGEPTTESVQQCSSLIAEQKPDGLIAVGGGATLDTGKLIRGVLAGGGANVLGFPERFPEPVLPYIALPTTAGTGAEAGVGAMVTDPVSRRKELIKRVELAADRAIADSDLTLDLPPHLTAWTGLDALAQAILAYVAAGDGALSGRLALTAIAQIWGWLPRAVQDPGEPEPREQMMLGSVMSAVAMFNAPPTYGAEHLFAEPLGAAFALPHGHAVSALIVPVAEYNAKLLVGEYAALGRHLGLAAHENTDPEAAERFVDGLRQMVHRLGIEPLRGPDEDELRVWVTARVSEGAFDANPGTVSVDDAMRMFAAGFRGDFALRSAPIEEMS